MTLPLYHWFISLKDSDKIALIGACIPFGLAILGGISWFVKRLFYKKKDASANVYYKSPKTTQVGKNNTIKINYTDNE